ncbi:MAG: anthranilate synthase component I family protein [Bacteroidales bacterium]
MKTTISTKHKAFLADITTPVSIYLKLRDVYAGSILLESSDFHHIENSYSFICLDPLAGFIAENNQIKTVLDNNIPEVKEMNSSVELTEALQNFFHSFEFRDNNHHVNGFFGYITFESAQYFDKINFDTSKNAEIIPTVRYHLYRFVISINHFKDQITITENLFPGEESQLEQLIFQIKNKPIPHYPFHVLSEETPNMSTENFKNLVKKAKQHCQRGDVFQLVLSRRFKHDFKGDEFNVYRALRTINPSPYLFYFDYGKYTIMGSSPEIQIKTQDNEAFVNPIAGTFRRSGDDAEDKQQAIRLLEDEKENSEHVMLVDLARNDLSKSTNDVKVLKYKEIQFYSHVIHIVSTVRGMMKDKKDGLKVLTDTFPAGTLTGAPKIRAMQLIDQYEPENRNFYGGSIGYIDTQGNINHAIIIRSMLSLQNTLHYQAGAGIINESKVDNECREVDHKLKALRKAILQAESINE